MVRRALLLGCLTVGCTNARFDPETLVKDLRVLAITAEPPEVGPGEPTRLSVLKTDPAVPGAVSTVLWVGCEPDPQDLGRSACNDASILLRPTQITDYPPGLQLLGFGLSSTYQSTRGVFDVLAADSPVRRAGSVGQVLSLVVGEEVDPLATDAKLKEYFARIERKETSVVVALTRVLVSQKPPEQRNRNPGIVNLVVDGAVHPLNGRVPVKPGAKVSLSVQVPESSRDTYVEEQPSGPVTKTEALVGSWYSSAGRFSAARFDTSTSERVTFFAPGSTEFPEDPVPANRTGTMWLVVRDDRGGQAFARYPFFVCDPALPNPVVTGVTASGNEVVVTGQNLNAALDVVVGDAAIARGVATAAGYVGDAPALAAGSYPVKVRGRNCNETDTGLRFTVP